MELTGRNSGERVTLRAGATLTVALAENPTTGFRWHPDDVPGLDLVDDGFDGAVEPRGASGTRRFTFRATRSGPLNLRLVLRRSWESTVAEEFTVRLEVAEA